MNTRINKISIVVIVGIFAIVMFAALAWSTVTDNAFATGNESNIDAAPTKEAVSTNEAAENVIPNIKFAINPSDEEAKEFVDIVGRKVKKSDTYLTCNITTYSDQEVLRLICQPSEDVASTATVNTESAESAGYHFYGFYIDNVPITNETTITESSEIEIRFVNPTKKLMITTLSPSIKPIEGYNIDLYDKSNNYVKTYLTDKKGECSIEVTDDMFGYYIFGHKEGLTELSFGIDETMFVEQTTFGMHGTIEEASNANFIFDSNSDNHLYFKTIVEAGIGKPWYFKYNACFQHYYSSKMVSSVYHVNDNGDIEIVRNDSKETITDVSNNGAKVNHWLAIYNASTNETTKELYPGDSLEVDLSVEGNFISLEPIYENPTPPGPDPDPGPTPTPSEQVNANAQTGDNTAALHLAILAIAAGAVVVFARKRSINK